MATWADVSRLALALPETVEADRRGDRVWSVRGRPFAWERPLRRGDLDALGAAAPDGPILAVRIAELGLRDALIGELPDVYFTIPHFDGFRAVLLRLDAAGPEELRDCLTEAWLAQAPVRLARAFREG